MSNVFDIAWLIPVLPLLGFIVLGLGRNVLPKGMSGGIGSLTVFASFIISIFVFLQVKDGNIHTAHYFDFIKIKALSIGADFKFDQLSSLFLLIITGVGFLI